MKSQGKFKRIFKYINMKTQLIKKQSSKGNLHINTALNIKYIY